MRMTTIILAACLTVPLAGVALAQGTAISPGQSISNQSGGAVAPAPAPSMTAAPVEAQPRAARSRKMSGKTMAKRRARAR